MSSYCTISDVYRWIPRGSVQNAARLIGGINTTSETLELDGHGFEADDALTFRAEAGGTLPTGITEGTTYYAIPVTDSTFKVATTPGGSAVNLGGSPVNVVVICQAPWSTWIEEASNEIECTLPAHVVPLSEPYPAVVVAYAAGLVAEKALAWAGVQSTGLQQRMVNTRNELREWRSKGLPVRGTAGAAQMSANLAVTSSYSGADPRGWVGRGGNTRIP